MIIESEFQLLNLSGKSKKIKNKKWIRKNEIKQIREVCNNKDRYYKICVSNDEWLHNFYNITSNDNNFDKIYQNMLSEVVKHEQETTYTCDVCQIVRYTFKSFKQHQLQHYKYLLYQCNGCKRVFKTRSTLISHIKKTHLTIERERVQCHICFKLVLNLDIHLLNHNGARYKCEFCQKKFIRKAFYEAHLLIHTGEKPYECHICHNRYNRKWNLKVHIKKHEEKKMKTGIYLPFKPRGRGYVSPTDEKCLGKDILQNHCKIVKQNSQSCDTSDLEFFKKDIDLNLTSIKNYENSGQLPYELPSMTGKKWIQALYSSASCDTSDIFYYSAFLQELNKQHS